jgi:hypothetical protein
MIIRRKSKAEKLKNMQIDQKSPCEVGTKEYIVSEEISTIKKKPSTFHGGNGKDALRAYQELAGPHPFQGKSHERVSSFERISLE